MAVNGARADALAHTSLVSSTRLSELDAAVWSNSTVRVMARNISGPTFGLATGMLSVGVAKRRVT
jgi:PDZ domain-containing secreted protein